MTKFYAFRFTPVFTTDPELDVRSGLAAQIAGQLHQLSNARLINGCERVALYDFQFLVVRQETSGIIPAHSKSRLGQVVCAKAEELSVLRNLVCHQSATRNLYHCSDKVVKADFVFFRYLRRHPVYNLDLKLQLLGIANQRDHNFRLGLDSLLLDLRSGLENCSCLHFGHFGKRNSKAATAMPEHRVEFV